MRHHPAHLIAAKRDGRALTAAEIQDLVSGVVDGTLGDAQLGAWLMAVCCKGMDVDETKALTLAMRDSGRILDLSSVPGVKVDKHSTGGVGDKVSLLLAPWVAAAGIPVPMISGRGLGHTGGTIDKLQAIPGYRTDLSSAEFVAVLRNTGFVMAGASQEVAPADRRMYATRDVTGTVESIPLITASILSKKLAAGIDALVMDVKCGRAAFMQSRAAAEALMQTIVATGKAAGTPVVALLTDMDTPLGCAVGNALEVREIVQCLTGDGPADLLEVTRALAAEMLVLGGKAANITEAGQRLDELRRSGAVAAALAANVKRQGGDPRFLDDPSVLGRAPVIEMITAPGGGFVVDVDPRAIGLIAMELGAGRRQPTDTIDPRVGIVLRKKLGDSVRRAEDLVEVHAARAIDESVRAAIHAAFKIGSTPVKVGSRVLERVS